MVVVGEEELVKMEEGEMVEEEVAKVVMVGEEAGGREEKAVGEEEGRVEVWVKVEVEVMEEMGVVVKAVEVLMEEGVASVEHQRVILEEMKEEGATEVE